MRKIVFSTLIALPLLAACASTGGVNSYQKDYDALDATCKGNGGILTTTGAQTGRPETDYACVIRGASRLPRE